MVSLGYNRLPDLGMLWLNRQLPLSERQSAQARTDMNELLAWHRRTGRGLPPGSLLPTLAAGGGLMGALLVVLTGAPTPWMLALLALAGVAHVLDLRRRWQPRVHQGG